MTDNEKDLKNPGHITAELCLAYRKTQTLQISAMQDKITFTIKITGAAITILLAMLTAGLHFFA